MTKQIVVRGKVITPVLVSAFARRVNSTDEIITQWANAAVLELTQNRNGNWFTDLFNTKAFRLNSGALNKLGTEVYQYVQAHFPRAVYDKETFVVGLKKFNPESPLADSFISVGDTEVNADLGIYELNGKFYRPQGDFALTFEEWKTFKASKSEVPDDQKPVQAKALAKSLEKALAAQAADLLIGAPLELVTLLENLGKLGEAVRGQMNKATQADLDTALAKLRAAQDAAEANTVAVGGFDLSPEEIEQIKANRLAAAEEVKVATGKPAGKMSRSARNKAAQEVADTALTGTVETPAADAAKAVA